MNESADWNLDWIIYYAKEIKKALKNGHSPMTAEVERLAELSQRVQREFDPKWQEWVNNLSCTK